MKQIEQVQLATSKVTHWRGKVERAAGILHKWETNLAKLQAKGAKPIEPTINKLPPLVMAPSTDDPKVVSIEQAKAKGKAKPKKK